MDSFHPVGVPRLSCLYACAHTLAYRYTRTCTHTYMYGPTDTHRCTDAHGHAWTHGCSERHKRRGLHQGALTQGCSVPCRSWAGLHRIPQGCDHDALVPAMVLPLLHHAIIPRPGQPGMSPQPCSAMMTFQAVDIVALLFPRFFSEVPSVVLAFCLGLVGWPQVLRPSSVKELSFLLKTGGFLIHGHSPVCF